jgi:cell division protein FtsL
MKSRANPVLAACLLFCALFLVNSQHQARRLFIELERAQAQTSQLEIEWAQLQVEQSTMSQHARIEASAKRDLNMMSLTPGSTMYLTPGVK